MQKSCSNCQQPVKYSVVVLLSSVGVSPRLQQSSVAISFCNDCLQELYERLCSDVLRKAVNSALTQLNQRSNEPSRARRA
jgi:hypothetical protein